MAKYRFSIDLGCFIGVRHISIPVGENGQAIPGIFIPTGINGIDVADDTRGEGRANQSKIRAFVNFQQRSLNNKYIQAIKDRLISRGEPVTATNIPAWSVCYSLSEEKRTRIRAALKRKVLAEHPEYNGQEDVKGTELSAAISRFVPFQMGDSYLIEESAQSYTPQYGYPAPQQVTGYTPAQMPDPSYQNEDLPF